MTTTTSLAAQSIGTSTNVGNSLFATKVTLAATTVAVVITARVTNAATAAITDARSQVIVRYALSPVSVAAAAAPALLSQNSRYVKVDGVATVSEDRAVDSEVQPATGQYLYFWCDVPPFNAAATLNVYVTEL